MEVQFEKHFRRQDNNLRQMKKFAQKYYLLLPQSNFIKNVATII